MKVLFVSTHFPVNFAKYAHGASDQTGMFHAHGSFKRMGTFVEAIKTNAEIDLLFYVSKRFDVSSNSILAFQDSLSRHWNTTLHLRLCHRREPPNNLNKLQLYGGGVVSFYRQAGNNFTSGREQVRAFENALTRSPDVIFVHRLDAMSPLLLTRAALPPVYFDLDDIEHVAAIRNFQHDLTLRSKLLASLELPALFWGERKAIRLARRTFVCSESDRRYLSKWWRLHRVVTVPNAVALPQRQPLPSNPTLLFLGSYWYKPNTQAAEFLLHQIWPLIYRAIPQARLIIGGPAPENIRGYNAGVPGTEFTGFIEDLDELYRRSRVVCAPILSGAGTRVKIIEAAAYRKPIVATPLGAEGLHLRDGREILLRENAKSFANACIELLTNDSLCERLGSGAYDAVVRHYELARTKSLIRSEVMAALEERSSLVSSPKRSQHEVQ
jgi:glycosyltransferase involved in cell wall biosynthesis